jgi:uncharacterized protein YndB with AHSA1/START domain
METQTKTITVQSTVKAPVEKVWNLWTTPEHIIKWCNASDDWQTTFAENDLRTGGNFVSRMEAKDGSFGFDFGGVYDNVKKHELIEYTMGDGRKASVTFSSMGDETKVTTIFEPESTNPEEMQRGGWQAISDNFKKFAESYNLELLKFDISINASAEKTYKTMIGKGTYDEWTSLFAKGSHFKGSWDKGSKILFLGPGENGEMGGMVSRIKENMPAKFVSIEHLGIVKDGKEITSGAEVVSWAGASENYRFTEKNGTTLLSVSMDSNNEFKNYFMETYPKALQKLKELCEA